MNKSNTNNVLDNRDQKKNTVIRTMLSLFLLLVRFLHSELVLVVFI
jgi:hypothetical protein